MKHVTNKNEPLPEELKKAIDKWIQKYPSTRRQSAILQALTIAQEYNGGYLSQYLIDAVADYLAMSRVTAYEVATFYTLYELKPVGRHKIGVCTNISCMLSGCDKIVKHLQTRLNINLGETTADKKFTLREVECLGACANAPVVHIGHRYYETLTPEKLDKILDGLDGQ
ncbi:NADH-quinone oxidoreductase subunit NuoE [Rickettsiella grylli]|uniref:NADH-quinone oxidoreductase subunit E n=1 Tax=Rickettsiella grylli TaxID=59196 RepID=A8PM85_9COXI|nr:NADH-quinone oxidoreductase subunit NuoE [Rickettsiella grylli]EDP46166.1 NADH-quinone oxidoreductase chain e (nadh dehydrogenasei, chain e) (ndh-1, chain e) [Rickettsiella grylli]